MYYTQDKRPKTIPSNAGDEFLDVFQEEIDKNTGMKSLVLVGKTNVYEKIQQDVESTKIENILAAMANGDFSMLRKQEPLYVDATTMPKTLMEAQNIVVRAKSEFEKLPADVKREFDFSAEKYVSEMGTKSFLEKMAPFNDKLKAIKEAGSAKEYEKKVQEQAKFEKDVEAAKGGTE